jgi:hypothetical protein
MDRHPLIEQDRLVATAQIVGTGLRMRNILVVAPRKQIPCPNAHQKHAMK